MRIVLGWLITVLALATVLLPPSCADAQNSAHATYKTLINEALAEFELGNWSEALALFGEAHKIKPNARTLRGIGMVLFELRRYVSSIDHLRRSLNDRRQPLTDQQRESVEELIKRARRFIGTVKLSVEPETATVLIDGTPIDKRKIMLDGGEHQFAAEADGYQTVLLTYAVRPNEVQSVSLKLPGTGMDAQPAEQQPTVDQAQRPEASQPTSPTLPEAATTAQPAVQQPVKDQQKRQAEKGAQSTRDESRISVAMDSRDQKAEDRSVPDEEAQDDEVQDTTGSIGDSLPWVFIGTGGALIASGLVTAVVVQTKYANLEDKCEARGNDTYVCEESYPSWEEERDAGETLQLATNLLWGVGSMVAAIGGWSCCSSTATNRSRLPWPFRPRYPTIAVS